MKVLESVIKFLQFEMTEPNLYGWFHVLSLVITVLLTYILCKKKYNTKKTLLVMSIIMIILEVYKQLSFSFNDNTWYYQWYAFPFQFCSTPMYIALIASLTKNKKLEKNLYCFLATYGMIAGLSVMLYPASVFIEETLINIQTMVHHGFMVVMGVFIIINEKLKPNLKTITDGLKVFITLVLIALITNIITYYIGIDGGLRLFYISPFHISELPVFNIIQENVPYIVFLMSYIFAFTVGGYILLIIVNKFKKQ